jgi:hypothetical protein
MYIFIILYIELAKITLTTFQANNQKKTYAPFDPHKRFQLTIIVKAVCNLMAHNHTNGTIIQIP